MAMRIYSDPPVFNLYSYFIFVFLSIVFKYYNVVVYVRQININQDSSNCRSIHTCVRRTILPVS